VTGITPTAHFASLVYGPRGMPLDDPAEAFHEASRLYPNVASGRLEVMRELARGGELNRTLARAGRTHDHRPTVALPPPRPLVGSLGDAIERRRSGQDEVLRPLGGSELAAILAAGYAADADGRRPVPSGGALYPLELYVVPAAVSGIATGIYHYQPFRHVLSCLADVSWASAREAFVDPAVLDRSAALLVVTAMFSRSRVKYGLRGYRFALLEAGHLVQNAVLAAAQLGVPALPVGGFYDRQLDALVGADGLDEASVYALALGGAA
jgi:SagB-type dehydrogenase family enzyme